MLERHIPEHAVDAVINRPEDVINQENGRLCYQSRFEVFGKIFLVRVIVALGEEELIVLTVYKTSNLQKYMRKSHDAPLSEE